MELQDDQVNWGEQSQKKKCFHCDQQGHIGFQCPFLYQSSNSSNDSDYSFNDSFNKKSREKSKKSMQQQESQKRSNFNNDYLTFQHLAKYKKELQEEYQRNYGGQKKPSRLPTTQSSQKSDDKNPEEKHRNQYKKELRNKNQKAHRKQQEKQFMTVIIANRKNYNYEKNQLYNFQKTPSFYYHQLQQLQLTCRICNGTNHTNHYCQNCGNPDSDHRARNCPYQFNRLIHYRQPSQKNEQLYHNNQQFVQINQFQQQKINISCKVVGCMDNHTQHFCKNCKNADSDHFSRNCAINISKSPKPRQMSCKVAQCRQQHHNHFCNVCGNKDSDHRSKNCPSTANRKKMCKVKNCYKDHQAHYCKVCQDKNSDHKAKNCPKGQEMYHGTTEQAAKAIMQSKINPSKNGNLGAGIYFTPVRQAAVGIAKLREKQNPGKKSVLIIANLRKVAGNFKERVHGPWKDAYNKDFVEVCVTDDKYMRIKSYQRV